MAAKPARTGRNPARTMTLGAHLRELRRRLIIVFIALVIGAAFGWWASDWVFVGLQSPIATVAAASGRQAALNFDTVAGSFDLRFEIALTLGLVASSPIWLWQVWAFLTPGLVKRERAYGIGFMCAAIPLFLGGCFVGWLLMPHLVELFVGFAPADSISNLSASYYYDFVLKLMIATGCGFVLPAILVLLNFAGVIRGMTILKGWRIAVLAIVVFTAATTPATDIVSMFLLAVPLLALYFLAVGISLINDRRRAKREAAFLAQEGLPDLGDVTA